MGCPANLANANTSTAHIGVRECIFLGMQKNFAQILSCFSQITNKQQVLISRLKRTIVNKSRCLPS